MNIGIPESVLSIMRCCCCSSKDSHIVNEAILLKCGGNACRLCLELNRKFTCSYCKQEHRQNQLQQQQHNQQHRDDLIVASKNPNIDVLIKVYSKELMQMLRNDFENEVKKVEYASLEDKLFKHLDLIEDEIDLKIESLKKQLDNWSLEMRHDLNRIRKSWKTYFPFDKIELIKDEYKECLKFEEIQDTYLSLKLIINDCIEKINSFKFKSSDMSSLNKRNSIGELYYPLFFNITNIKSSKLIPLTSTSTSSSSSLSKLSLTTSNSNNNLTKFNENLLFLECDSKEVKLLTKKGELMDTIQLKASLSIQPSVINFCPKLKQIFIGDKKEIHLYDSEFNYVKSILMRNLIKNINSIEVDNEQDHLYVADTSNNTIYLINYETGCLLKQITIDSPTKIKQNNNNKLYTISLTKYDKSSLNRLEKIIKGSNCIFELDKASLKITKTIKIDKWLCPKGLYIDSTSDSLLTTAFILNGNKDTISDSRYLYLIDIKTCISLKIINLMINLSDFIYNENKLFTINNKNNSNDIYIIEFNQ